MSLALMKTGMSALSMAQCDELQEIVRTCGVRSAENDGQELGTAPGVPRRPARSCWMRSMRSATAKAHRAPQSRPKAFATFCRRRA